MPAFRDFLYAHHKKGDFDIIYEPSRQDVSGVPDANINYYGFLNRDGGWIIRQDHSANGTFLYAIGDSGFLASWSNRTTLTYVDYNAI